MQGLMVQVEGVIYQGLLSWQRQQGALDITQFGKSDSQFMVFNRLHFYEINFLD